jgi:hypothetical protein
MRFRGRSGTSGEATSNDEPEELEPKQEEPERKWPWPKNRDELRKMWVGQLSNDDAEDYKKRETWVDELLARSFRVLDKRDQASTDSKASHWFLRGSAGASAAVATLTGGTLIGSVHGTVATVIGIGAAVVGLVAAGVVAAKPEQSYAINAVQKCQYQQLWWDMRSYALTQLPTAGENGFNKALDAFAKREANIMGTTASAAPS